MIHTSSPHILSARGVAEYLGWLWANGHGNAERVRILYRAGRFPAPIDPELSPRIWHGRSRWWRPYVDHGHGSSRTTPGSQASVTLPTRANVDLGHSGR